MRDKTPSITNIAIVGGGENCREFLEKSILDYHEGEINARIVAVADADPDKPGIVLARKMGLRIFRDYHDLYHLRHNIHLIAILTPNPAVLGDILETKPDHIRLLSYPAFRLFREAISVEERKLRARNQEIETILNGIQDFIIVLNPDMDIIEVNDAFISKMEFSRNEVIGQKCHKIFQQLDYPCGDEQMACPLKGVVRNKRPSRQVIRRINRKGAPRYIEVSTFPVWEKDGKISKFVEISRDITKRKMEEEEITRRLETMVNDRTRQLKETHDKLLHKDKMASLGKLSAAVVHEINNPLAGILNLTMLIRRILVEDGLVRNQQIMDYLVLMETETRRVSRIISNLLAFSRQSKVDTDRFDLNRLIEKTLVLNANLLKIHGARVIRKFARNLPELSGSSDQLQQVFMNLVSNAAESLAATGGGRLEIATRHDKRKEQAVVRIRDSGAGIAPEDMLRLFEPFFTTKRRGKGVGLGLSVAYGIIKEHGGSIDVESKPGQGGTFTVRLPLDGTLPEAGG